MVIQTLHIPLWLSFHCVLTNTVTVSSYFELGLCFSFSTRLQSCRWSPVVKCVMWFWNSFYLFISRLLTVEENAMMHYTKLFCWSWLTVCPQDWRSSVNCCCPSSSGEKHFSTLTVTFLTCTLHVRHRLTSSPLRDDIWTSLRNLTEHAMIEVWKQPHNRPLA